MSEKTPWFPPETKPVRVGFYETKAIPNEEAASFINWWDGEQFHYEMNRSKATLPCMNQNRYWRGLTEPAK